MNKDYIGLLGFLEKAQASCLVGDLENQDGTAQ